MLLSGIFSFSHNIFDSFISQGHVTSTVYCSEVEKKYRTESRFMAKRHEEIKKKNYRRTEFTCLWNDVTRHAE